MSDVPPIKPGQEKFWAGIDALDVSGRDDFHTGLIRQEVIMMMSLLRSNKDFKPTDDVEPIAQRRGFNTQEARNLMTAAAYLENNRWTVWEL